MRVLERFCGFKLSLDIKCFKDFGIEEHSAFRRHFASEFDRGVELVSKINKAVNFVFAYGPH